jgi:hypothetical protein
MIWLFSKPALFAMAIAYMLSGIVIRVGGIVRRRLKPPPPEPEHQVG